MVIYSYSFSYKSILQCFPKLQFLTAPLKVLVHDIEDSGYSEKIAIAYRNKKEQMPVEDSFGYYFWVLDFNSRLSKRLGM